MQVGFKLAQLCCGGNPLAATKGFVCWWQGVFLKLTASLLVVTEGVGIERGFPGGAVGSDPFNRSRPITALADTENRMGKKSGLFHRHKTVAPRRRQPHALDQPPAFADAQPSRNGGTVWDSNHLDHQRQSGRVGFRSKRIKK